MPHARRCSVASRRKRRNSLRGTSSVKARKSAHVRMTEHHALPLFRLNLRPRVSLGFPGLELLEQRLAVGVGLDGGGRRRALFQEFIEPGTRHRFDVVGLQPLLGDRQALPIGADSETSFHFGWKGGFWKVGNLVKNASTNSDSLR